MNTLRKKPQPPPPWHPDFRDSTVLPDVKLVRTSFFVNALSVIICLGVALAVVRHETNRHTLRTERQSLEAQIGENRARNDEVLKMERQFQSEERLLREVSQFVEGSLQASVFLAALGDTLPPDIAMNNLRFQDLSERGVVVGKSLMLNGAIHGTPDIAASAITDYVRVFRQHEVFAANVEKAVPTSLVPTPEGDLMAFGIELTLTFAAPEGDGAKTAAGRGD